MFEKKPKVDYFIYEDKDRLDDLIPKFKKAIEEANLKCNEEEPDFLSDDRVLTRHLRARQYNIKDALKQLEGTVEWRKNYKPWTAECKWCIETPGYHSMRQIGHDKYGRPIVYGCFGQAQTNKNTAEDSVAHSVYLMENAFKSSPEWTWIFIIDCTHMTLPCCNPSIGHEVARILGSYYPERLGKVLVINHNPLFHHVWHAIKVFLDPKTAQKMKFIRSLSKMEEYLTRICDETTKKWILEEIKLNETLTEDQLRFWSNELDNSVKSHDPRGTKGYVEKFILPLEEDTDLKTLSHLPHPNIVAYQKGEKYSNIALVKSKTLNEPDSPDETLLQRFGITKKKDVNLAENDSSPDEDVAGKFKNLFKFNK